MEKVIYGVNAILLFLIARYEYTSDNDKTILLSSFGFLIIVILNFIFGFFAQLDKKPIYKHYYFSALGLIVSAFIIFSIW